MESLIHFFDTIPSSYRSAILVGGLATFWLWESIVPLFRMNYNKWKHAGVNLFFTLTTVVINFAFAYLILLTSDWAVANKVGLLHWFELPLWAFALVGLMLLDLGGAYFIHWLEHRVRWMWRFHLIHHADTHVDTTTANRHHPGESVFRAVFTTLSVLVVGAPMWLVMLYQSLSALLSQFNHANISLPLWLDRAIRWFIVSPNMHKIHHHYVLPLTDTNYGNIFSIWDRLFGTFATVSDISTLRYGIDTHLKEEENSQIDNLLKIPFQPYRPPVGTEARHQNYKLSFTFQNMKAYIFPGQGSQFAGMGKDLYEQSEAAKMLFEQANEVLGFRITDIMFGGTEEELKQTKVTQPAIFIHSVVLAMISPDFAPEMVAGHSLGEFSALVAAKALSYEDGLRLVARRAFAMQKACEAQPSTMGAVLGVEDEVVEKICAEVSQSEEVVVAANYNCPGQLVISGSFKGIEMAGEQLKNAGAKRVLPLTVGGAFHSPLMLPAETELAEAIRQTSFHTPICPIYQNVDAKAHSNPEAIKANLIAQLTAPVRWTQSVQQMVADGATSFVECGPGKVLQGLVKKIDKNAQAQSIA